MMVMQYRSRLQAKAEATHQIMSQIIKDCDRYQTKIMAFYFAGVIAAVESMGGLEIWIEVVPSCRLEIFGRIFDAAPLDIAMAALGPVAVDLPIHDIFSDTSAQHLKWQQFHRTVFVLACEDTFKFRIASNKRMECFKFWPGMTAGGHFEALKLGDMRDIPVKWGSQSPRKRQHVRVEQEDQKIWATDT